MAKKITMHQKTATGYDVLHPDTHIAQVKCPADVASEVGAETGDGQAIMQSISATDKMISGYGTTTGTSKAFVLALEGKPDMAIVDGMMIRVKFHLASDEEPTIDVNGSGAKNIYSLNQSKLLFTIAKNVWVVLMYSASLDGWIVQGWAKKKIFHTEVITKSTNWIVPEVAGKLNVRLFGGGGGGGRGRNAGYSNPPCGAGGGGGHMAFESLSLKYGDIVSITIGKGGDSDGSGGVTSFGSLVSASGGTASRATGASGTGGGGGKYNGDGASGSYGGGGGGGGYGGNGGGGGAYGGGGGGNNALVISGRYYPTTGGSGRNGSYAGGKASSQGNGGSGGGYASAAVDGTPGNGVDTRGFGLDFEGEGKAGSVYGGGGGGYGGNGGNGAGGGGGGYGGNGGTGSSSAGGGGGGGYGGNGGDAGSGGGGGGGYGLNGNGGKGGSYNTNAGNGGLAAGGGGGYADDSTAKTGGSGGSGVCILTYWSWDSEY